MMIFFVCILYFAIIFILYFTAKRRKSYVGRFARTFFNVRVCCMDECVLSVAYLTFRSLRYFMGVVPII